MPTIRQADVPLSVHFEQARGLPNAVAWRCGWSDMEQPAQSAGIYQQNVGVIIKHIYIYVYLGLYGFSNLYCSLNHKKQYMSGYFNSI